jgi:hypothetical protein
MMVFERATLRPENVRLGGHFKGQLHLTLLVPDELLHLGLFVLTGTP